MIAPGARDKVAFSVNTPGVFRVSSIPHPSATALSMVRPAKSSAVYLQAMGVFSTDLN
jgi:hypothetical protein